MWEPEFVTHANFYGVNTPTMKFQTSSVMFLNTSLEGIYTIRKPVEQLQHTTVLPKTQALILGYKGESSRAYFSQASISR